MIRVKEIYQAVINRSLSWTTDHNFMSRGRSSSSTTIQLRITLIQINHDGLTRVAPSATFAFSFFLDRKEQAAAGTRVALSYATQLSLVNMNRI